MGRNGNTATGFHEEPGLGPAHTLLDVGCGALRGGVRFVDYLAPGHYFGLDSNASLIAAGHMELKRKGLSGKQPTLLVDNDFGFHRFGRRFDFAIAQSVFTHFPAPLIVECLIKITQVLKPGGEFFATFFEAPTRAYASPLSHQPGGIVTYPDKDPYHYSLSEFEKIATTVRLGLRVIGDWQHPRDQKMLAFKAIGH